MTDIPFHFSQAIPQQHSDLEAINDPFKLFSHKIEK